MADHAYNLINVFKDYGINLISSKKDSILLGEVFELKSKNLYELRNAKSGEFFSDSAIFYYKNTGQDSLLAEFYFKTLDKLINVQQIERFAKIVKDLNFICLEYNCDKEQLLTAEVMRLFYFFRKII